MVSCYEQPPERHATNTVTSMVCYHFDLSANELGEAKIPKKWVSICKQRRGQMTECVTMTPLGGPVFTCDRAESKAEILKLPANHCRKLGSTDGHSGYEGLST